MEGSVDYAFVMSPCYCCASAFFCQLHGRTDCESCIGLVNEKRKERVFDLWPVAEGAYGRREESEFTLTNNKN